MTREEQFEQKLDEFWHLANCAIKAKQRKTFNVWHWRLCVAMDNLRDEMRRLSGPEEDPRWNRAFANMKAAMDLIAAIPWLST